MNSSSMQHTRRKPLCFGATLHPSKCALMSWVSRSVAPNSHFSAGQMSTTIDEVQEFRWDTIPKLRRNFIHNTAVIFILMHDDWEKRLMDLPDPKPYLLKYSQMYRTALREARDACINNNNSESEIEEYGTLSQIHSIWHLFELFFFNDYAVPVGSQIAEWLQENYPDYELQLDESRIASLESDTNLFWETLKRLILRGRISDAQKVLLLSNLSKNAAVYLQLQRILQELPKSRQFHTNAEFGTRFHSWQRSIKDLMNDGKFISAIPSANKFETEIVEKVFQILAGDEETILEESKDWMEALVATLLFVEPTAAMNEVPDILQSVLQHFEGIPEPEMFVDQTLVALFRLDFDEAISLTHTIDSWLVGHLADFYYIERPDVESGKFVEYELLSYSLTLLCDRTLWHLGFDYLSYCPVAKETCMEEVVLRIPIQSETKLRKVIALCHSFAMYPEAQAIYNIQAKEALRQERYGVAIQNYLMAGELHKIDTVCDVLAGSFVRSGDISILEVVEDFGTATIKENQKMSFLHGYLNFYRQYREDNRRAAAKCLVALLTCAHVPDCFWPTLLFDTIPLLESEALVFNLLDTDEIMRSLEEMQLLNFVNDWYHNGKKLSMKELESQLEVVRLSCLRNGARVICRR